MSHFQVIQKQEGFGAVGARRGMWHPGHPARASDSDCWLAADAHSVWGDDLTLGHWEHSSGALHSHSSSVSNSPLEGKQSTLLEQFAISLWASYPQEPVVIIISPGPR